VVETESAGGLLAGRRILIVEDETLISMLLETMVADLGGAIVASATRLSRAMEIVRDGSVAIDLAILDVNLGGEEAFPIAEVLAERGVPFAFSTGYGSAGLPARWRDRPTLQKPFTETQVAAVLGAALAGK
jgi:DNA-binding response OmpR family regulator